MASAVAPRTQFELLRIGKGQEAAKGRVDRTAISPTDADQHRRPMLLDALAHAVRADVAKGERRPRKGIPWPGEAPHRVEDVVVLPGGEDRLQLAAAAVVVDRLRPGEDERQQPAAQPRHLGQSADVAAIEQIVELPPLRDEVLVEHATHKSDANRGIEVPEERRDRLDRLPPGRREYLGGVPFVRDAVASDAPVRPRLGDDPVDDLAIVRHFIRRPFDEARPGRGPTAARVHLDDGIPRVVEGAHVALDIRGAIEAIPPARERPPRHRADVPRAVDHRRYLLPRCQVWRQPEIDRDLDRVPHHQVPRRIPHQAGRNAALPLRLPRRNPDNRREEHQQCQYSQPLRNLPNHRAPLDGLPPVDRRRPRWQNGRGHPHSVPPHDAALVDLKPVGADAGGWTQFPSFEGEKLHDQLIALEAFDRGNLGIADFEMSVEGVA